ncbi:hypothetical protein [Nostoc cycadae]|uniref:hypothetical protein n=1 Tax=Nostoc cycadae TaxID=246795 RepID=UPI001651A39D|nr:hypothetical protein [Nostoc cycadae]
MQLAAERSQPELIAAQFKPPTPLPRTTTSVCLTTFPKTTPKLLLANYRSL